MVRTFLGYEENRGARHVLYLLIIVFVLCVASVVVGGLGHLPKSSAEAVSPISKASDSSAGDDVTWFASSNTSKQNKEGQSLDSSHDEKADAVVGQVMNDKGKTKETSEEIVGEGSDSTAQARRDALRQRIIASN